MITNDELYAAFYSTTFRRKVDMLDRMKGERFDIAGALDAISDGAGGCERMSYTTPAGHVGWVSCLMTNNGRQQYAYIEMDGDLCTRATWCSPSPYAWHNDSLEPASEDDPRIYAEVFRLVEGVEDEDE